MDEWGAAPRSGVHASTIVLKAISSALRELEGDTSLGKRIRATQELARLLSTVAAGDPGVRRLCDGRGVPSLLVALMDVCGEERQVTRNTILEALARLARQRAAGAGM